MKGFYKLNILLLLAGLLAFGGCKLENSHNGKLDGYWKLCSIDNLTDESSTDLTSESIFWAVQKDLLVVRDNASTFIEYVFRFSKSNTELTLKDAQKYDKKNGNSAVSDMSLLEKFGIYSQPITYHIDDLSMSKMTLSTEIIRLNFKKF